LYQPRHKESSALRQILLHSLQATRKALEAAEVYLPRLAWRELDAIIDCGGLEKGFVRVVCAGCKHERVVGFSCKGRSPRSLGRGGVFVHLALAEK